MTVSKKRLTNNYGHFYALFNVIADRCVGQTTHHLMEPVIQDNAKSQGLLIKEFLGQMPNERKLWEAYISPNFSTSPSRTVIGKNVFSTLKETQIAAKKLNTSIGTSKISQELLPSQIVFPDVITKGDTLYYIRHEFVKRAMIIQESKIEDAKLTCTAEGAYQLDIGVKIPFDIDCPTTVNHIANDFDTITLCTNEDDHSSWLYNQKHDRGVLQISADREVIEEIARELAETVYANIQAFLPKATGPA